MLDQTHERYDKNICLCVCLLGHSHQPLQGPLLVDLVGAVRDVRIEIGLSVLVHDVADVIDHNVLLVFFLQFLKEPAYRMKKCVKDSYRTWQQLESEVSNHESSHTGEN